MDQVNSNTTLIKVFIGFLIAGAGIWVLILLTAAISSKVIRHPTWFSFCLSWLLWGVSFSLLFLAGQQRNPTPPRALCIAQAALAYSMPPLAGSTSFALVFFLLLTIQSARLPPRNKKRPYSTFLLVSIPWFFGIMVFVSFLVYSIKHQNEVELSHNGTYCILNDKFVPKITAAMATVLAIGIFVLQVMIAVIVYPHRRSLGAISQQSISLGCQLVLFTVVVMCAGGLGLVFVITKTRGAIFDVTLGGVPLATSIIFASQRDILMAWLFWRPSSVAPSHTMSQRTRYLGETISIGWETSVLPNSEHLSHISST